MALASSMTAFANVGDVVNDLTQLSSTKCYTITPRDNTRGTWCYYDATPNYLNSTTRSKAEIDNSDPNQQFVFIKSSTGYYYVYSVGAKKFLARKGAAAGVSAGVTLVSTIDDATSRGAILSATNDDKANYPWVVAVDGHQLNLCNATSGETYGVVFYDDLGDVGNGIKLTEAGDFAESADVIQQVEEAEAKVKKCDEANSYLNILANSVGGYSKDLLDALNTACGGDGVADFADLENEGFDAAINALKSATPIAFSNDKVYKVRDFLADRGFLMTRTEEGNSRIFSSTKTGDATLALPVVEGSDIWQVYSDGTKMYLYNTAVKKYAKLDEPNDQWLLVNEPTPLNIGKNESKGAGVYWIQDCDYLGSQDYMHINIGQNDLTGVKGWDTSADASNFYFIEVDGEAQDLLNEVTKAVKAEAQLMVSSIDPTKANYVGAYSTVSVENLNGLLSKENVTASEIREGINELEANRMMPQSGKYYIFQNTKVFNDGSLKNIYENPDGVNIAWRTGTQEAAELWQIEPADDGRYYFKSANTGKYINQPLTKTATMKDNGTAYALMEQSYCSFGLEHQEPSDKVTLSLSNSDSWGILPNGSEESGKYLHTYNSYGTNPTQWNIIEVSSVNLTIGSTGYATAYFPFAVTIPEGVKAYTVSAAADGVATLRPLTGTIPANTGVILSGEVETAYPFAITTSEVSKVEGNLLDGVTMATNIPETSYILANKNGNLGFYKVDPSDTKLAANKAYLNNANGSFFSLKLDGAVTGIQSVENAAENAPAYDLQGRRLPQVPTKGLYIQNGKKIMK